MSTCILEVFTSFRSELVCPSGMDKQTLIPKTPLHRTNRAPYSEGHIKPNQGLMSTHHVLSLKKGTCPIELNSY